MNKEKICLFYQYSSTMYYWQKWFKNKYRDYIEKSIDMERSFHLKNGTVLYFRIPADNMAGQRFDKELNGERLELLCLNYENKELHNKIDKAIELLNQYLKDWDNSYLIKEDLNTIRCVLKDSDVDDNR